MDIAITAEELIRSGLNQTQANKLVDDLNAIIAKCLTSEQAWSEISQQLLSANYPFSTHRFIFTCLNPTWHDHPEIAPAWQPTPEIMEHANLTKLMASTNLSDVKAIHDWSCKNYNDFWQKMIGTLGIIFKKNPDKLCDLSQGIETPKWLPGAQMNIADSCFTAAPTATAIIYQDQTKQLVKMSYAELNHLSNRIANSLVKQGFIAGDAIAIVMPMNVNAVAIYLGIIKMGGVVVSIADSFSPQEMATRLNIAKAKCAFTQDVIAWNGKKIPLYEKLKTANAPKTIVLTSNTKTEILLRDTDLSWDDFIQDNINFTSVACDPMSACNILFSSGTTAEPKAIVWNHTTPIKSASDAHLHQNIQTDDILAWPTNLGWMMGPWLVFATLINRAAIALCTGAPKDRAFGEFIQDAKVTMLGVVPTLVATWRQSKCMENLDWQAIKVFGSTGECSNPEDMLYLMSLGGYKPIIEYCGGTEIGGGYVSSTVLQPNYPSLFSTATFGLNFTILDEQGKESNIGEVAIIPPSIGLSTTLLNANHHQVYFTNMPTIRETVLRKHGDQIKRYENGYYSILGRVDDSMNLGGIKVSAAEIERVLVGINDIIEVAAIAITPPDNGPSQLVIYAAGNTQLEKKLVMIEMQRRINNELNPLFKIYDVVFITDLPKTASNKIMRRILRKKYQEEINV